jgi:2',3'-cyclic-nucleotide 2'-phosphodiesterase
LACPLLALQAMTAIPNGTTSMRLLFVADVFGVPGRRAVESRLPDLRHELDVDFCIVNGENAADGAGLTAKLAERLLERGADVVTTGNHVWRHRDLYPLLDSHQRLLRPANFGGLGAPGRGSCVAPARDGTPVGVLNLQGGLFMESHAHPFSVAEQLVEELRRQTPIVFVDFHAEATSEKIALARLLDGKATAVIGTHTHVQTNDPRVLPGGTAALTDAGMTGPHDSVIGVRADLAIARMRTGLPVRFQPAEGDVRIEGAVVVCDPDGRATSCETLRIRAD